MCNKKIFTKAEAVAALACIRLTRKMNGSHKRRNEKRHYYCNLCEGYHLTSQKKKSNRSKMRPFDIKLRTKTLRLA